MYRYAIVTICLSGYWAYADFKQCVVPHSMIGAGRHWVSYHHWFAILSIEQPYNARRFSLAIMLYRAFSSFTMPCLSFRQKGLNMGRIYNYFHSLLNSIHRFSLSLILSIEDRHEGKALRHARYESYSYICNLRRFAPYAANAFILLEHTKQRIYLLRAVDTILFFSTITIRANMRYI